MPPDKALQLTSYSSFQSSFGSILAGTGLGPRPAAGLQLGAQSLGQQGSVSGESILLTHAEVSAVVAGFASVVAALQRPLSPFQRHRFLAILLVALASVMAALVPVWLSESGVASQPLWRAASGIMLVFGVAVGAINLFATRTLPDGWGITFNRPVTLLLQMIGVGTFGLFAFNLFGPTPRFSFYYGSLLAALFTAFIVFADAILGQEDRAS